MINLHKIKSYKGFLQEVRHDRKKQQKRIELISNLQLL